ncbi:unnamed protein product [Amoebophrya sp. A25]|nr:unnamed protein product [Amoebophrya sp. A25]|eukprot:GSA25T00017399001.1
MFVMRSGQQQLLRTTSSSTFCVLPAGVFRIPTSTSTPTSSCRSTSTSTTISASCGRRCMSTSSMVLAAASSPAHTSSDISKKVKKFGDSDSPYNDCMMDICIVPVGVGVSVREEVTAVEKVLRDPKWRLKGVFLHGYGTNIQVHWDDCCAALKACHAVLHNDHGVTRITTSIRLGTRVDKKQSIEDKIHSVAEKL